MKRTTLILATLALLLGFASCKESGKDPKPGDKGGITALIVEPSTLTLELGTPEKETAKLNVKWTPANVKATPEFASKDTKIATVSADGTVKAVAKGNTTIVVTIGEKTAECDVVVNKKGEKPIIKENELPALLFDVFWSGDKLMSAFNGQTVGDDILAYEKEMGRTQQGKVAFNSQMTLPAFVNKSFGLIPAVSYGANFVDRWCCLALVKETIENCPETMKMLKKNGFSDVKKVTDKETGATVLVGSHDKKSYIRLTAMPTDQGKEFGAHMLLMIGKSYESDFYSHDMVSTAVDIPSFEKLMTNDIAQIKEFETTLGFRKINDKDVSKTENIGFTVIDEKTASTNIMMANYINKPSSGVPFITSIPLSIKHAGKLASKETVAWMDANGYVPKKDKDGKHENGWLGGKGYFAPGYAYVSKDGKAEALLYIRYIDMAGLIVATLQISPAEQKTSLSKSMIQPRAGLKLSKEVSPFSRLNSNVR